MEAGAKGTPTTGFKSIRLQKTQTLGVGSYGSVCKAKCDDLLCAAKIIHPTLYDPTAQQQIERHREHRLAFRRFQQECEFMSAIKHPNIVQYLGTHEDPETGLPVLLMELMDESLTHFLESSQNPVPYHTKVNLCHDITLAISYLHSNGIIHRDLSSNNVLLYANVKAKVTDFGMAKLGDANPRATLTMVPGTDVYMPPEAVKEQPVYTAKIDCFATGVLIIQILTRQFPKPGERQRGVQTTDSQFPSGIAYTNVPEIERRQNHISQVDPNHPLLPIALNCLEDSDAKRPSAQELCLRVAALKKTLRYTESVKNAQERRPEQDNTTEREEQIRELQQQIQQKDDIIREKEQILQQRDEDLRKKDDIIHNKNDTIQEKDDVIQNKTSIIQEKEKQIQDLHYTISSQHSSLQKKDDIIQDKQEIIAAKQPENYELRQQLTATLQSKQDLENQLEISTSERDSLQQQLEQTHNEMDKLHESFDETNEVRNDLQQQLDRVTKENDELKQHQESIIAEKEETIEELRKQLKELEQNLRETTDELINNRQSYEQRVSEASQHATTQIRLVWKSVENARCTMSRHTDAVVDGDQVYFRNEDTTEMFVYNATKDKWNPLPHSETEKCSLAVINSLLTTIGGNRDGSETNQLFSLTGEGARQEWKDIFPPMLTCRSRSSVVCTKEAVIVAGGYQNKTSLRQVEVMEIATQNWSIAADLITPLDSASATICGDHIYMLGGYSGFAGLIASKSVYTCSLADLLLSCQARSIREPLARPLSVTAQADVWSKVSDLPVEGSVCVSINGRLLAIGGCSPIMPRDAVRIYNPVTNKWHIISRMSVSRYDCFAAILPNDRLMVVGGYKLPWPAKKSSNSVEIATIEFKKR